jgi:Uma2 family endonuclease
MSTAAPRLPSFEELYAEIERLPEGTIGEILEPGVVHTMSRPARPHRQAAKRVLVSLGRSDVGLGGTGWWIEVECEVRLGLRLFDPDLAGWRVERVPQLPDENPISIVPDWACEVLSPGTARTDRTIKLPHYARSGVAWVWLVDPELRTVEVYETDPSGRPLLTLAASEAEVVILPPFEADVELAGLWIPSGTSRASPPGAPGASGDGR